MSGKGYVHANEGPKIEERWKMVSLLEKLEVLDMFDMRIRTARAKHHYGVNRSTIFFIQKTEDVGRGSTKATECEHFLSKP